MNLALQLSLAIAGSLALAAVVMAAPIHAQQSDIFKFALIGDLGYSEVEEVEIPRMMAEIDAADLVFVIHDGDPLERPASERTGFNDFIDALREEVLPFPGPAVLVHGDTHYFRIDKPLFAEGRQIQSFTRVETFGSPETNWVEATVDPSDPNLFQFRPMIVPSNLVER